MLKDFTSLFTKDSLIEKNTSNSFNDLKDFITVINQNESLKENIYHNIAKRIIGVSYGIAYIGSFHLLIKSYSSWWSWLESAILSIPIGAFLGTLGFVMIFTLIDLIKIIFNLNRGHIGLFSKKFKNATNDIAANKKALIQTLQNPTVQYEVLSFLKNLKTNLNENSQQEDKLLIEDHLNKLITFFTQKNYNHAAIFVTSWMYLWLDIKNDINLDQQKIADNSTTTDLEQSYLKSLNFSLDDKEVEMEKEYNLKSML